MPDTAHRLPVTQPRPGGTGVSPVGVFAYFARDVLARVPHPLRGWGTDTAAERDRLSLTAHLVFPRLNDTLWVNLTGRRYHAESIVTNCYYKIGTKTNG